jgi:hypothetical protein
MMNQLRALAGRLSSIRRASSSFIASSVSCGKRSGRRFRTPCNLSGRVHIERRHRTHPSVRTGKPSGVRRGVHEYARVRKNETAHCTRAVPLCTTTRASVMPVSRLSRMLARTRSHTFGHSCTGGDEHAYAHVGSLRTTRAHTRVAHAALAPLSALPSLAVSGLLTRHSP